MKRSAGLVSRISMYDNKDFCGYILICHNWNSSFFDNKECLYLCNFTNMFVILATEHCVVDLIVVEFGQQWMLIVHRSMPSMSNGTQLTERALSGLLHPSWL